ncbi:hypothetical protein EAF00_007332 [Botryotinia globosa]|nr:hypothetical protein EAF00_007332 [Botryotinia globosa]
MENPFTNPGVFTPKNTSKFETPGKKDSEGWEEKAKDPEYLKAEIEHWGQWIVDFKIDDSTRQELLLRLYISSMAKYYTDTGLPSPELFRLFKLQFGGWTATDFYRIDTPTQVYFNNLLTLRGIIVKTKNSSITRVLAELVTLSWKEVRQRLKKRHEFIETIEEVSGSEEEEENPRPGRSRQPGAPGRTAGERDSSDSGDDDSEDSQGDNDGFGRRGGNGNNNGGNRHEGRRVAPPPVDDEEEETDYSRVFSNLARSFPKDIVYVGDGDSIKFKLKA